MYYNKLAKYQNKLILFQKGGLLPQYAYHSNIGGRPYQEDRVYTVNGKNYVILSVFDGHGGADTSEYLRNLPLRCRDELDKIQVPITQQMITDIIKKEFAKIDQEVNPAMKKPFTGSTASMCIVFDDYIYVANIADSPIILFDRNGTRIQKTNIHDCNNPVEFARINADFEYPQCESTGANYRLTSGPLPDGNYDRGLDMTRAFGDNVYKPKSNAVPEISIWKRIPGQILCICSDSFLDTKLDYSEYKQNEDDIIKEVLPVLVVNKFDLQASVNAIVDERATHIYNSDNTSMIIALL
jgi:serine/threonine protein phosphatase PrpC